MGRRIWFAALMGSICLEGLARKILPAFPQVTWYFLKDVVLLSGVLAFGIGQNEVRAARWLYRGFGFVLAAGIAWTVAEMMNPNQASATLALIGFRAYWLWWLAPLVVASIVRGEEDRIAAVSTWALIAVAVAVYAAYQFEFPLDAEVNRYAWGSEEMAIAGVGETGRVRVTSTFSYISGFADFGVLSVPLLLALGLGAPGRMSKALCFVGAAAIGAALPMSGSRAPVVMVAVAALAIVWTAGSLRSREGRVIIAGAFAVATIGWFAAPEAVQGVQSRFEGGDTQRRFVEFLQVLPPVALAVNNYPMLGVGTGMQQNARFPLGVRHEWESEGEVGRYLIELGLPGYLLIWAARLGIAIALIRAMRLFRQGGRRSLAGACVALAGFEMIGNMTFDHVWQALFFTALGLLHQAAVPLVPRQVTQQRLARHPVILPRVS
jgi:hypothetical protein